MTWSLLKKISLKGPRLAKRRAALQRRGLRILPPGILCEKIPLFLLNGYFIWTSRSTPRLAGDIPWLLVGRCLMKSRRIEAPCFKIVGSLVSHFPAPGTLGPAEPLNGVKTGKKWQPMNVQTAGLV